MAGVILMYHRVAEVATDVHRLAISPALFSEQLGRLLQHFRPYPLEELTTEGFAVTLDDGTVDARQAAEILRSFSVPATFFVNTAQLDEPHESWWDTLEWLFIDGQYPLPPEIELAGRRLSTQTREQRWQAHHELSALLRDADRKDRSALLTTIVTWSHAELTPRASHRCMTSLEIRALAAGGGNTIGAHGVDHLQLVSLPAEAQRTELAECQATLAGLLGSAPTALSYAYGAHDAATVELARALGFTCAVTVEERAVTARDDRLRLPRIDASQPHPDELVEKVRELTRAAD